MPTKVNRGEPKLATEDQIAEILHISPNSLKVARAGGRGDFATLRWYKAGGCVRYDLTHLYEVWLPARERGGDAARVA